MTTRIRAVSALLGAAMLLLSGCTSETPPVLRQQTLRTHIDAIPDDLHPHTRSAEADFAGSFCEIGFAAVNADGTWQYEMAEEITDVTAEFADRKKWGIEDDSGRVFRIRLNQAAQWSDKTPITADTYLDSMKQLLSPTAQNCGALPYTTGSGAILNAEQYRRSGAVIYAPCVSPYGEDELADYSFDLSENQVYLHLTTREMTLTDAFSIRDIYEAGYIDTALYDRIAGQADKYGYIPVTEENEADVRALAERVLAWFGLLFSEDYYKEMLFYSTGEKEKAVDFSRVGLIKTGVYELTYITAEPISLEDFLSSTTKLWLIHPDGRKMYPSYGPYILSSLTEDGILYEKNPFWYGWSDGAHDGLYQSTSVLCSVLTDEEAAAQFERGRLDLLRNEEDGTCTVSGRITGGTDVRLIGYLYDDADWASYTAARSGYPYR